MLFVSGGSLGENKRRSSSGDDVEKLVTAANAIMANLMEQCSVMMK